MQIGFIGLGKMGANMVARRREDGHDVIGYVHPYSDGVVEIPLAPTPACPSTGGRRRVPAL